VPPNSFPGLAGKTVCLAGFKTAFVFDQLPDEPTQPKTELPGYEYVEVTDDQEDRWDDDIDNGEDEIPESRWTKIGAIGMHPLFSLTDPGQYFSEVLAFDLGAQGAKVLTKCAPADADVTVGGNLTYLKVDQAFFVGWAGAVVDADLSNRAGPAGKKTFRVVGSNAVGWGDARFENYRVVRESAQRISRLLIAELQAAAAGAPAAVVPAPVAPPEEEAAPVASASAPAAAPSSTPPSPGGCSKDTDCKGDRVCDRGNCVAPTR
jgi:hypothetical protein